MHPPLDFAVNLKLLFLKSLKKPTQLQTYAIIHEKRRMPPRAELIPGGEALSHRGLFPGLETKWSLPGQILEFLGSDDFFCPCILSPSALECL